MKCGMLINNVNNVKRWFYEKNYEYFIVDSYVTIGNPNICGSAAIFKYLTAKLATKVVID